MTDSNAHAEKGREILKSRAAQGKPGEKQPPHKVAHDNAQKVVDQLKEVAANSQELKPRPPSASKENGNYHIPAAERTFVPPAGGGGAQAAAGAVAAAAAHIEDELIAEARIKSDPRWEADQKKFEMGMRGELGYLPPVTQDEKDNPPQTPEEQNARDLPKLEKARQTAEQIRSGENINPTVERARTDADNVKDNQVRTGAGKNTLAGAPATATPATPPIPPASERATPLPGGPSSDVNAIAPTKESKPIA